MMTMFLWELKTWLYSPYVTKPEDEDSEEEEDFNLLPTDNLIAVGHVEGDAAILEIYGLLLIISIQKPMYNS
jgi:hypothetical protein